MTSKDIKQCLSDIRERVDSAVKLRAEKMSSAEMPVRLVAVSKLQPIEAILEAYDCGQRVFGENYIQELIDKSSDKRIVDSCPDIEWHIIGHIQSNKVNKLLSVDRLTTIETIDSLKLAQSLETVLARTGKSVKAMVQINTSGEENKYGIPAEAALPLVKFVRDDCPHLNFIGLMTVGRFGHDPSTGTNPDFEELLVCRDSICKALDVELNSIELSFGMSADFEHAIALGSTEVRVGSVIFGERDYTKK